MDTSIETTIGEINVTCFYEYSPAERQTFDCPGNDEEVAITAVYINGDEDQDIGSALNDKTLTALSVECLESMEPDGEPDPYEDCDYDYQH